MLSIILKKTPFSETNEVITLYTREQGKVRAVARAVKSPKSKLAYALQPLYYSDVELLPSKNMPAVIGVKQLDTFKNIQDDLNRIYAAMFATEVVLKSTADEQSNENLFDLYLEFLKHLDSADQSKHSCTFAFGIKAMALIGYEVGALSKRVPKPLVDFAVATQGLSFAQCDSLPINEQEIKKELKDFISAILERKLNSAGYLE